MCRIGTSVSRLTPSTKGLVFWLPIAPRAWPYGIAKTLPSPRCSSPTKSGRPSLKECAVANGTRSANIKGSLRPPLFMKTLPLVVLPGLGGKRKDYRRFNATFPNCYVWYPKWEYKTLTYLKADFKKFLKSHNLNDGEYKAVGFSMGAYVLACSNVKPFQTVYASLTPLFKEDLKKWPPKWRKALGKRRFKDLGVYVPKPFTTFVMGKNEPRFFQDCQDRLASEKEWRVTLEGVGHDVFDSSYFNFLRYKLQ